MTPMSLVTLISMSTAAMLAGIAARQGGDQSATPSQVALGDSVFHGRAGNALCYVCHGPAGKGVPGLGPDLTDAEWVNGDGSLAFIEKVVLEGVAKPKKMPAPMPPRGGGQLTDAQVKAVAAYVRSLAKPKK